MTRKMAKFNWRSFLKSHNIVFVEFGSNVAKGHINIKCPFCGSSDPSHHMGLDESTGYWGCWRSKAHRGKSPVRLIMQLTGCSSQAALEITGRGKEVNYSDFDRAVSMLKEEPVVESKKQSTLRMPPSFRKITNSGYGPKFKNYLMERGFDSGDLGDVIAEYNLRYTMVGAWAHRLIIPVYTNKGLVTWTSRSILPDEKVRYKSLSHKREEEGLTALENIKDTLFHYPELKRTGGRILFITEGPFDAMKLDFYGVSKDVRATCLYSTTISEKQRWLIHDLAQDFDEVKVCLDTKELVSNFILVEALSDLNVSWFPLDDVADPGELSPHQVLRLI
jgi:hypothetical protein